MLRLQIHHNRKEYLLLYNLNVKQNINIYLQILPSKNLNIFILSFSLFYYHRSIHLLK